MLLAFFFIASIFTRANAQIIVDDLHAIITFPPPVNCTINSDTIKYKSANNFPKAKTATIKIFREVGNNSTLVYEENIVAEIINSSNNTGKSTTPVTAVFKGFIYTKQWENTTGRFAMRSEFFAENGQSLGLGASSFKFTKKFQHVKKKKKKSNNQ